MATSSRPAFVHAPDEPEYQEAVHGFNTIFVHAPTVVARPRSVGEVVESVQYAAAAGLAVTVMNTGHGLASVVDEGMLLSVGALDEITIRPELGTATVGGGVQWRELVRAAAAHGLGGPCGSSSDVGVVGYLLGGGLPVLGRAFGYAVERLRRAEIVTADGGVRTVDASDADDLYWALRGAGHGLGVVTTVELELAPIAQIAGGGVFFSGEDAAAVLAAYAGWVATVPDELCSSLAFLHLPALDEVPAPLRGRRVVHLRVTHPDPEFDLSDALAPLRASAPVIMEHVGRMPYAELDRIHQDPDTPCPATDRGTLLGPLTEAAQADLLGRVGVVADTPLTVVELRHLGGRLRSGVDCAIGSRDADFSLYAVGLAAGPGVAGIHAALTGLFDDMRPHATGRNLVNLFGCAGPPAERELAWSAPQRARVAAVKRAVDPAGLFR